MAINFTELESALYHIRVNHLGNAVENFRITFEPHDKIMVWNEANECVGQFTIANVLEEIADLQNGVIDFCDLWANEIDS